MMLNKFKSADYARSVEKKKGNSKNMLRSDWFYGFMQPTWYLRTYAALQSSTRVNAPVEETYKATEDVNGETITVLILNLQKLS